MNDRTVVLLVSSIFIIVGIILVIVTIIINRIADKKIARCTSKLNGEVVGNSVAHYGGGETLIYYPVIKVYMNGAYEERTPGYGQSPPKYKVGDKVVILYNPDNTDEWLIENDNGIIKLITIVMLLISILITIVGILLMIVLH
ncbi:MAG: DUF3592 domain-containing protein [Lachnospiraceae bacterium]|nr:DUF3592 domain-containing protein [Lachnospiraceae bacterium]